MRYVAASLLIDRQIDRQTDTQNDYYNPPAHAPRVNKVSHHLLQYYPVIIICIPHLRLTYKYMEGVAILEHANFE